MSIVSSCCRCFSALAIGLGFVSNVLRSQVVIYDNLGSANEFSRAGGYSVSGPDSSDPEARITYMMFTAPGSYSLESVDVGFRFFEGAGALHVDLFASDGGVPGERRERWTLTGLQSPGDGAVWPPEHLVSSLHPVLTDRTNYILAMSAEGESVVGWCPNTLNIYGVMGQSARATPLTFSSDVQGAYRVTGISIPKPSAATVVLSVAAIGAALWWKRRKGITSSAISPNHRQPLAQ